MKIRKLIVLFGDSLTEYGFGVDGQVGWAGLLQAAYTRRADVLGRGFSGYNTRHALEVLPRVFGREQYPGIFFGTVFLGANDAQMEGGVQHVPVDEYRDNLRKIVQAIREQAGDDFPIVVMTPPPVYEPDWGDFLKGNGASEGESDRTNERARLYGSQAKAVAEEMNCLCLDVFELLDGSSLPEQRHQYLSDGLHLNEQGNRKLYQGLMDLLQQNRPDLCPMSEDDGRGKYGKVGVPYEEKLWRELCGLPL